MNQLNALSNRVEYYDFEQFHRLLIKRDEDLGAQPSSLKGNNAVSIITTGVDHSQASLYGAIYHHIRAVEAIEDFELMLHEACRSAITKLAAAGDPRSQRSLLEQYDARFRN
jgi:hypothetical protein